MRTSETSLTRYGVRWLAPGQPAIGLNLPGRPRSTRDHEAKGWRCALPASGLRDLDLMGDATDFHAVNTRTFSRLMLILVVVAGAAFGGSTGVVSMGDNTFSVACEAPNTFNRDTEVLKTAALQEAEKYCQEKGKQLKVVTWTVYKPRFISGYANAKLVFKALNQGDPELISEPAPLPTAHPGLATGENDDLYSELLKLDDLRKKGILTEKEFESEKKKALKRKR